MKLPPEVATRLQEYSEWYDKATSLQRARSRAEGERVHRELQDWIDNGGRRPQVTPSGVPCRVRPHARKRRGGRRGGARRCASTDDAPGEPAPPTASGGAS
jgi:hypothetical protein